MKEVLKIVYGWIIKFLQTIVSILCIILFNKHRATNKIRKLRLKQKRRAVSVIANGPSACEIVKERDDLLKNTDLLVLNYFGNQEDFFRLKPQYYIIIDPVFFDENFVNKGLTENNPNRGRSEQYKLIDNFKKVNWEMTLFIPALQSGRSMLFPLDKNPNINVVFFNATRVIGFEWFQNIMYHMGEGVPSSRNVIIPATILMIYLGYKTIYLYGCEFSWTKTMDVDLKKGKMFFNDRHFYSQDEVRYFEKGAYLWWLKAIVEMLTGIEQVSKFAIKEGVRIVNRTKGSFIDVFNYENPDSIVK